MKRTINNQFLRTILIIFSCALVFAACDPQKKLIDNTTTVKEVNKTEVFYTQYKSNVLKYNTMTMKYNGKFNDGDKKISFAGTIKIKKDSALWMNVTAMGFEVARLLLTPDSVKLINRLQSVYYAGNYSFIERKANLNINYNMVQSILTNVAFPYHNKANSSFPNDFIFSNDSNTVTLQSHSDKAVKAALKPGSNAKKPIFQKLLFAAGVGEGLHNVEIKDYPTLRFAKIDYLDFEDLENTKFPNMINVTTSKQDFNMDVNLKYSKININKELSFSFNIPEKYNRIK